MNMTGRDDRLWVVHGDGKDLNSKENGGNNHLLFWWEYTWTLAWHFARGEKHNLWSWSNGDYSRRRDCKYDGIKEHAVLAV